MGFDPNESWTPWPGGAPDFSSSPAPAPAPAPAVDTAPPPGQWGGASQQTKTTAGGAPVDQYGNRMDTDAGRAKSAQMQAQAQIDAVNAAFKVAQSEASYGRAQSAQNALDVAQKNVNAYVSTQDLLRGGPAVSQGITQQVRTPAQQRSDANLQNFINQAATTKQNIQGMIDKLNTPVNTPVIPDNKPPDNKPSTLPPSPFNPIISRSPESIPPPSPTLIPAKDVVNFQTQPASIEAMEQILFEQIGGYELINLVRRDTVEGQNPFYTLISNLSSVRRDLDPSQIISLQKANQTGFERYEISLEQRIPGEKYLTNNNISNFFYIASNGDLVIELDNVKDDEEIEVQMASSGKIT